MAGLVSNILPSHQALDTVLPIWKASLSYDPNEARILQKLTNIIVYTLIMPQPLQWWYTVFAYRCNEFRIIREHSLTQQLEPMYSTQQLISAKTLSDNVCVVLPLMQEYIDIQSI